MTQSLWKMPRQDQKFLEPHYCMYVGINPLNWTRSLKSCDSIIWRHCINNALLFKERKEVLLLALLQPRICLIMLWSIIKIDPTLWLCIEIQHKVSPLSLKRLEPNIKATAHVSQACLHEIIKGTCEIGSPYIDRLEYIRSPLSRPRFLEPGA